MDSAERQNLEHIIETTYPDDPAIILDNEEADSNRLNDEEAMYELSYKLASPDSFPFFNYSSSGGDIETQYLLIYKEPRCGTRYTRFIIALADDPYRGCGEDGLLVLKK